MATTLPAPAHRPARRASTDELVAAGAATAVHRFGIAHCGLVATEARQAARHELQEALAVAQDLADGHWQARLELYARAALLPQYTEYDIVRIGGELLALPGDPDENVDLALALLEGWTTRQRLTGGGVR